MGTPWCANFPTVDIPTGRDPKPVQMIYPFYENPDFLRFQLRQWAALPPEIRDYLSLILVDDGSPAPAADVLESARPWPIAIRLLRLEVDIRWNWIGARNRGAREARPGWLMLTDMDHVLTPLTAHALVYGIHDPRVMYGFSRTEHTGAMLAPHPNSWFVDRALFWKIGGYDEALSGFYGTDGEFRRRVAATAPLEILRNRLVRYEYIGDSSTRAYKRKQPEDAAVGRIVKARRPDWRPKVGSFPWHEVPLNAG